VTGSSEVEGSKPDNPRRHGFLWFNGQMKDLGTFGGTDSYTLGVNNLGHVIGMATDAQRDWKAYFYDGTQKQRLPKVAPGMFPMDINNHDEIVGVSDQGVFITTNGRSYLLKDLLKGGNNWSSLDEGLSINDAGDVLGRGRKNGRRETFIARRIAP
jgi:probable HAF family extracellular repeat protein